MAFDSVVERESWILHEGKTILFHDYRGIQGEDRVDIVRLHGSAVAARGQRGLLLLVDVTDAIADKELVRAFKETSRANRALFGKIAVVGVAGLLKVFAQTVTRFADLAPSYFDTIDEAKDWLAKDAD